MHTVPVTHLWGRLKIIHTTSSQSARSILCVAMVWIHKNSLHFKSEQVWRGNSPGSASLNYCLSFLSILSIPVYSITALQNKVLAVAAVDWQTLSSSQLFDLTGHDLTDSQSAAREGGGRGGGGRGGGGGIGKNPTTLSPKTPPSSSSS